MKSGQLLAGANFGQHELALATESVGQGLVEFPTGLAQEKARKGGAGPPRHVLPVKLREQGADRLGRRVMARADRADLRKRFLVPAQAVLLQYRGNAGGISGETKARAGHRRYLARSPEPAGLLRREAVRDRGKLRDVYEHDRHVVLQLAPRLPDQLGGDLGIAVVHGKHVVVRGT